MKKIYTLLLAFLFSVVSSQDLHKLAQEITEEGITLYRSEMASWYGSDVFVENYKQKENIAGYFSYIDGNVPKCVFFSKDRKVIGTISFPTSYNPKDAKLDLTERTFTPTETKYFDIRQKALNRINSDPVFKRFNNANFNIVPIVTKEEQKVYVITGTNVDNVVLFGNDYLISFDKTNEISKVQPLHKSLLPQNIIDEKVGKTISGIHSHILDDWQFMTPTDICTLMLYQKFTDWESYTVISKEFTSSWNAQSNFLTITKTDLDHRTNEVQETKKD